MEVIKLSKNEIESKFQTAAILKDIITLLESEVQKQGKIICTLRVNNLMLTESDESRFSLTKIADIHSIEIGVLSQSNIVQDSLISLRAYSQNLKNDILLSADFMRKEDEANFHHQFTKTLRDTQLLSEGLIALKPHLHALKDKIELETKWLSAEKDMVKALTELIEAYQTQDMVRVCDILEYDLSSNVDLWLEIMPAL